MILVFALHELKEVLEMVSACLLVIRLKDPIPFYRMNLKSRANLGKSCPSITYPFSAALIMTKKQRNSTVHKVRQTADLLYECTEGTILLSWHLP